MNTELSQSQQRRFIETQTKDLVHLFWVHPTAADPDTGAIANTSDRFSVQFHAKECD